MTAAINGALRRIPVWPVYLLSALWAGWLFWLGATGGLGAEPINALEREYGYAALVLLVAALAVTPVRRFTGVTFLRFRRALGVACFGFVLAHLGVWMLLDLQSLARVAEDIAKRPYVTVGMAAFVLLLPLAITSNDLALRRMGALAWRRLHQLTYPAAILVALHYLWLTRGNAVEPMLWAAVIGLLLVLRIRWRTGG